MNAWTLHASVYVPGRERYTGTKAFRQKYSYLWRLPQCFVCQITYVSDAYDSNQQKQTP